MTPRRELPIVYSCSGCSSAAQLANWVAIGLDRRGEAEMSCIAGIGGDVPSLVRLALSGRAIVAIDGCQLHCAARCLARHDVTPDLHVTLSEEGVPKKLHAEFDPQQAAEVLERLSWRLPAVMAAHRQKHAPAEEPAPPTPPANDPGQAGP